MRQVTCELLCPYTILLLYTFRLVAVTSSSNRKNSTGHQDSRFVLNLKKTSLAQSEVKFLGHIIGSGQRKADPDKVKVVSEMMRPENKK